MLRREPRIAFALASLTLLLFVQSFSVLLSAEFAISYDAVFPSFDPALLALALLPALSLLAPALPFSLWIDRRFTIQLAACVVAAARIGVCFEPFPVRAMAAALTVAAGAVFLGKVVGYMDRRIVAAAIATAVNADQLLRFLGWTWDVSIRPDWLPVQIGVSLVLGGLAFSWAAVSRERERIEHDEDTLERRAGAMRLRGAVALGCILFIDQAAIGNTAAVAQWTGMPFGPTAALLIVGGAGAMALLLAAPGPTGRERPASLLMAVAVGVVALLLQTRATGGVTGVLLATFAHGAILLLLDRATVPAGGRRRGWRLGTGLVIMLLFHVAYGGTFFYAHLWQPLRGAADLIFAIAALLLIASLALLPKPVPSETRLRRTRSAAIAFAAIAIAAVALAARRGGPAAVPSNGELDVATYNVHYGFDATWTYDPETIARAIEQAAPDVIALQEVPAGVPALLGTDLSVWLAHRLGMTAHFAPHTNGLLGTAVLTTRQVADFSIVELPPEADSRVVARVRFGDAALPTVFATHLSDRADARALQVGPLVAASRTGPAVLLADLNATPQSAVLRALLGAGFTDAFSGNATPAPPTAPATNPTERVDWILTRDVAARNATVLPFVGSDHRLVHATIATVR